MSASFLSYATFWPLTSLVIIKTCLFPVALPSWKLLCVPLLCVNSTEYNKFGSLINSIHFLKCLHHQ